MKSREIARGKQAISCVSVFKRTVQRKLASRIHILSDSILKIMTEKDENQPLQDEAFGSDDQQQDTNAPMMNMMSSLSRNMGAMSSNAQTHSWRRRLRSKEKVAPFAE